MSLCWIQESERSKMYLGLGLSPMHRWTAWIQLMSCKKPNYIQARRLGVFWPMTSQTTKETLCNLFQWSHMVWSVSCQVWEGSNVPKWNNQSTSWMMAATAYFPCGCCVLQLGGQQMCKENTFVGPLHSLITPAPRKLGWPLVCMYQVCDLDSHIDFSNQF